MDALPQLSTPGPWTAVLEPRARGPLEAALPALLVEQRWFGGKARRIRAVELLDAAPVGPGPDAPRVALLRVAYEAGGAEVYSLPLAFAAGAAADRIRAAAPRRAVAELRADGVAGLLHASDVDPAFARAVVGVIAGNGRLAAGAGELVGWRTRAFSRDAAGGDAEPRPLAAEQSNTSIRFGDRAILKLFRRVEPGPNPDVEVGAYLTDVAGFRGAAPVLGAVEYRPRAGEPYVLGVLHAFVRNEGDAWGVALAQVAGFLARVAGRPPPAPAAAPLLERARAEPPEALRALAGEALASAALLGRRTAELHLALAAHPEEPAFRPEPFGDADVRALHDAARASVEGGLALLAQRRSTLPPEARARAGEVLARAGALEERVRWVLGRRLGGRRIRTHGDLHLGQVLSTGGDFVVVDFEGEPARPLAERRAKGSALRDVAGMIRSHDYAASAGLRALARAGPEAAAWARLWSRGVAAAYLRAYLDVAAGGDVLPTDRAELAGLLDLHLVEKAAYELAYELNNRPDWVALPLDGILDLLGAPGTAEDAVAKKATTKAAPAARQPAPAAPPTILPGGGPGEVDQHLWNEGTNHRAYRSMGAHLTTVEGVAGTSFAVWAPNAERVSVIGDFNGWAKDRHVLRPLGGSGIWQGFAPGVQHGAVYKYHLRSRERGYEVDKADPFGFMHENAPGTQSIVHDLSYEWGDEAWMRSRAARNGMAAPMSVYELHLGSWRRGDGNRMLTYRELAPMLADYVQDAGFTHVELMPVTEHPFYGSWGYQTTGYFAPTSRYGNPQDFMFLVDTLHQRGIGVILDWVPSHFPADVHGLSFFDGTHLFEHADRRQGHQPDWDSYVFNYGRNEVRSFLLSSAMFWLEVYHLDGLRVDAVASMLYLDYSRKEGEWIPNRYGGRENLEAIAFLRRLNEVVYGEHPEVQTIAEESTSWPMVSRPLYVGGLGFGMKWDMGWMHDTLAYMSHDPIHRRFHHNAITFRQMYAFAENFVLPLSHDEVVHGKRSLLDKMPGDAWQKFANLRLLLAYQWAQNGKKLLFMGGEFGQGLEWSHDRSLDWHLLGVEAHAGVLRWVKDLNRALREHGALHRRDFDHRGFEWVDANDSEESVLTFLRRGGEGDRDVLVALNFTPIPRTAYRVGVPRGGWWKEILNSDSTQYGGAGWGNLGGQEAAPVGAHGRLHSLVLTLPPLGAVFLTPG
jgi:1,4-alpha-glucan branching enzyme